MKGRGSSACIVAVVARVKSDPQAMYPRGIRYVKFPPNGDCADMVNLNLVQRFLQFQLDERVEER